MAAWAPLIVKLLFWSISLVVVIAPRRWSLLAYLVVVQLDVSGPGWASSSTVGLENAIKVLGLPLVLLLRARLEPLSALWGWPLRLWALFTAWVALATLWSPYPLSAAKMVAYLIAYPLVFLIFAHAWRTGLLNLQQIVGALWASLLLAVLQSDLLGNPFGMPPKLIPEPSRFTTFAPPQFYAAFLVSVGSLLLLGPGLSRGRAERLLLLASGGGVIVGLLLVGSRYAFIGALALVAVAWLARLVERGRRIVPLRSLLVASALLLAVVGTAGVLAPNSRVFALRKLVAHGRLNPNSIGTLQWRLELYHLALQGIERRGPIALLAGSGTGSAAKLVETFDPTFFPAATIDPNRSMHNEFLRALYEWGLVGALLFGAFVVSLVLGFARLTRQAGLPAVVAFWGLLPTLLLGLTLENVLAGSGTPVGTGFVLVIAYAAAAGLRPVYRQGARHADTLRPQLLPATRG